MTPVNVVAAERLERDALLMPEGTTERDMALEIARAWREMTESEFVQAAARL